MNISYKDQSLKMFHPFSPYIQTLIALICIQKCDEYVGHSTSPYHLLTPLHRPLQPPSPPLHPPLPPLSAPRQALLLYRLFKRTIKSYERQLEMVFSELSFLHKNKVRNGILQIHS